MSTQLPPGYPLAWPDDWKRTPASRRQRSHYQTTFDDARRQAERSLRLLKVNRFSFTADVPLRLDGKPMASARPPADPGVALWWVDRGELRVMACDQWLSVRENMRAIGLALEALRALERAGASQILERTKDSFAVPALTAGLPWFCAALELDHWPVFVEELTAARKRQLVKTHPDQNGGDATKFYELNQAYNAACAALGGGAR